MRSAVINVNSNIVENVIVADPTKDTAPNNYYLVDITNNTNVSIGWSYDVKNKIFIEPVIVQ